MNHLFYGILTDDYSRSNSIDVKVTAVTTGNTIIRSTTGTVRDQSGQVIPGVTVILSGPTAPQTEVTDDQGQFTFPDLVPGNYVVTAQFGDLFAETQVTVPGTPIPSRFAAEDFP